MLKRLSLALNPFSRICFLSWTTPTAIIKDFNLRRRRRRRLPLPTLNYSVGCFSHAAGGGFALFNRNTTRPLIDGQGVKHDVKSLALAPAPRSDRAEQ
jgi:hypothetical protein